MRKRSSKPGDRPPHRPGVVEAEQFILRDQAGRIRGQMFCDPTGNPQLRLMDEHGRPQLLAGVITEASVVVLCAQGRPLVELTARSDGAGASMAVTDAAGTERVAVRFGEDCGSMVVTLDGNGKTLVQLSSAPTGESGVQIIDPAGGPRAGMYWRDGLPGMVTVTDASGQYSAGFGPDHFDDRAEAGPASPTAGPPPAVN
jgi:hypothetical protein